MKDPLKAVSNEARDQLRKRKQPLWTKPMLATLTHEPFSDEEWIYERKLDGERCLAFCKGKQVHLRSRNRKRLNKTYPELADALRKQECSDFIIDGEVVAFKRGVTSFSRLQQRMKTTDEEKARQSNVAVYFYVFDLLHLNGHDLTRLPLRERKKVLQKALKFHDPVRYTTHRKRRGEQFQEEACKKGWEGVIAKKADSPYVHSRSRDWLKFKCENQQEFVIGGYTDPEGSRVGFGALLIGYYAGKNLQYAGMVGTGFDDYFLKRLSKQLSRIERKSPAFSDSEKLPTKNVHWTTPRLVAQVAFTEWTNGKLRHPRFLGLRRDKKPEAVVRENSKA